MSTSITNRRPVEARHSVLSVFSVKTDGFDFSAVEPGSSKVPQIKTLFISYTVLVLTCFCLQNFIVSVATNNYY